MSNLVNRFKFLIGVEFIVEIDEVCSSVSLATTQAVSGEVACLSTLETGVVSHATRGSYSRCIGP